MLHYLDGQRKGEREDECKADVHFGLEERGCVQKVHNTSNNERGLYKTASEYVSLGREEG